MTIPCQALAQSPTPETESEKATTADKASKATRSESARRGSQTDKTKDGKSGGKVVIDNPFDVTAREKPSAFFLFQRSTMDYDWARLDARFSPLVLESVQDPLF
jgi:hypothetical protein